MMTERERFEAWAKSRGNQMQMIEGEYACPITSDQWEAWRARCPDGWQVVPKTVTAEMDAAYASDAYDTAQQCHDAVLAAAPKPGDDNEL